MHYEGYKLSASNDIRCSRARDRCSYRLNLTGLCDLNTMKHSDACCKLMSNDMAEYIANYIIKHSLNDDVDDNNNTKDQRLKTKKRALVSKRSSKSMVSNQSSKPLVSKQSSKPTVSKKASKPTVSKRQRVDVTPSPSQAQGKRIYCHYKYYRHYYYYYR